jgi:hypothetical protein
VEGRTGIIETLKSQKKILKNRAAQKAMEDAIKELERLHRIIDDYVAICGHGSREISRLTNLLEMWKKAASE